MSTKVNVNWVKDMLFDAEVSGHHVKMDLDVQFGGNDEGARPKPLLLAALSGCSGMDVVSILKKMKVPAYTFKIGLDADSTSEHPIIYHTIRMDFYFAGEDLPEDKFVKAVRLSTEKYCGVNAMLKKAANIIVRIFINGQEVTYNED